LIYRGKNMNKNMNRHGKASTNGESSSHSDKEKMLCEIGAQLHHGLPPDSPKICPLINKKQWPPRLTGA
jgi:hypothetical protein